MELQKFFRNTLVIYLLSLIYRVFLTYIVPHTEIDKNDRYYYFSSFSIFKYK